MNYFDYEKVAREAGIGPEALDELCRHVREDYPFDDMLFELHVLRVCMSVRDGVVALDEAISSAARSASS